MVQPPHSQLTCVTLGNLFAVSIKWEQYTTIWSKGDKLLCVWKRMKEQDGDREGERV